MCFLKSLSLNTTDIKKNALSLHAGDRVLLSGVVYTARDAAHKRIMEIIRDGGELPFEIDGAVIYYAGPTPAPEGMPIGSCGPTTSCGMDPYTPTLLDMGLAATVGKGDRSDEVVDSIVRSGSIYLCAIGGAGALAAKSVVSCEVVAFEDLGCESVKRLVVKDFPLIVAIDSQGNCLKGGK